jgi:hypothetical protein
VEVIAVRKLIITLILLSIHMLILSVEELLIFSEAGSGLRLEKQFIEESETELFTTFSTELQTPVSRLAVDGSIYSFASLDSLTNWQTNLVYERMFPLVNISFSGHYLEDENDSLDVRNVTAQLFKQRESATSFSEYGIGGRSSSFSEYKAFSNLEFNFYWLTKKFLKNYSVHHEFNAATKYFTDTDPLLTINYQLTFSFPTTDYSGLNLVYFINQNIIERKKLLYPNEELFDLFSYNLQKLSLGYTVENNNLLIKPWLALISKDYLATAAVQPYSEFSFMAGFYADWLMADGFMAYMEGLYQTINGDREIAYEFVTGLKIQFEIISR